MAFIGILEILELERPYRGTLNIRSRKIYQILTDDVSRNLESTIPEKSKKALRSNFLC